jgi:hypothetical protein
MQGLAHTGCVRNDVAEDDALFGFEASGKCRAWRAGIRNSVLLGLVSPTHAGKERTEESADPLVPLSPSSYLLSPSTQYYHCLAKRLRGCFTTARWPLHVCGDCSSIRGKRSEAARRSCAPLDITTESHMCASAQGAMPPRMDEGDILPPPVPSLLGTTTVFDDAVYLGEALGLPVNQTEDDLDAELALLAQESGIHDPYRFLSSLQDISRALSTVTLDSDQGSSLSVRSEETQSTGFTSAPSRTSRDQVYNGERPAGPRVPLRNAPAVRAADCNGTLAIPPVETEICEQTPGCASPEIKRRNSASNMSVAQSTLSMSSSVSSLAPRRKRVSGLFGMFRRDFRYADSALRR